jgi:hypothetical protein
MESHPVVQAHDSRWIVDLRVLRLLQKSWLPSCGPSSARSGLSLGRMARSPGGAPHAVGRADRAGVLLWFHADPPPGFQKWRPCARVASYPTRGLAAGSGARPDIASKQAFKVHR